MATPSPPLLPIARYLEGHGAVPLALLVLGHVEAEDVLGAHRLARDGALLVLYIEGGGGEDRNFGVN